jgi:hypothetical protein
MSVTLAPIGRLRDSARVSSREPKYFKGSAVSWLGEFRDPATGALTSATNVEFVFVTPAGVEVEVAGVLVSTGVYSADITVSTVGNWVVHLRTDGSRVDERAFGVVASATADDPETPTIVVGDDDELTVTVSDDLIFVIA